MIKGIGIIEASKIRLTIFILPLEDDQPRSGEDGRQCVPGGSAKTSRPLGPVRCARRRVSWK